MGDVWSKVAIQTWLWSKHWFINAVKPSLVDADEPEQARSSVFHYDAVLWNQWLMILEVHWESSVLEHSHLEWHSLKCQILRWYFSLSAIVWCDTGAEISQTAIDGLWRGVAFFFLLWAEFRSCCHLCWCQPPQQDDHQSRWCHCYLTVHIITTEVKWESYCASL